MTRLAHQDTARRLVVFSDIEMGAGGPTDDFPRTAWLGDLIRRHLAATPAHVELVYVFNGDTFDFLKTTPPGVAQPRFVTEAISCAKLDRIASAHAGFFASLGAALAAPGRNVSAVFVVGNHDLDLVFPAVQTRVRRLLGDSPSVSFAGRGVEFGDAWIEHGHQEDPMFRFDFESPTVAHNGDEVLRLPWGAVGVVDVALPLHPLLCHHDRIRPRGRVFQLMPEVRQLVIGRLWRYWSRDYVRRWWGREDPLARVSWRMFRELAWRLGTANAKLSVHDRYRVRLQEGSHRLMVIGHEHESSWWTWGERKLLTTGCLRCEFYLSDDGEREALLPSVYAEIDQDEEGRTLSSELREVQGPEPPPGWQPESIFAVAERVRAILAADEDGTDAENESEEQAAREGDDAPPAAGA